MVVELLDSVSQDFGLGVVLVSQESFQRPLTDVVALFLHQLVSGYLLSVWIPHVTFVTAFFVLAALPAVRATTEVRQVSLGLPATLATILDRGRSPLALIPHEYIHQITPSGLAQLCDLLAIGTQRLGCLLAAMTLEGDTLRTSRILLEVVPCSVRLMASRATVD